MFQKSSYHTLSETICTINLKFLENILRYIKLRYIINELNLEVLSEYFLLNIRAKVWLLFFQASKFKRFYPVFINFNAVAILKVQIWCLFIANLYVLFIYRLAYLQISSVCPINPHAHLTLSVSRWTPTMQSHNIKFNGFQSNSGCTKINSCHLPVLPVFRARP